MKQLLEKAFALFSQLYFLGNLRTHEAVSENRSLLLRRDPFFLLLMVVGLIIVQFKERFAFFILQTWRCYSFGSVATDAEFS